MTGPDLNKAACRHILSSPRRYVHIVSDIWFSTERVCAKGAICTIHLVRLLGRTAVGVHFGHCGVACGECGKYLQAGAGTERAAALDGHPVVVFTRHKWRPERGSRDRARSVRATAPNSNRDGDFASVLRLAFRPEGFLSHSLTLTGRKTQGRATKARELQFNSLK